MPNWPASVERVRAALAFLGAEAEIRQFDQSTRTAAEAAATVGCEIGAIAKSLVFRTLPSSRPILAIVSGSNRADEMALAQLLTDTITGERIGRADAEFVRAETGFAIGGVPPLGHANALVTAIDADLNRYETIWAAAGRPDTVFSLTPDQLALWTGGIIGDFAKR